MPGEQVREGARQDDGFLVLFVIGRAEIDRVLVDAFEKQRRDLGHARFGVAHGGRVIAVDIAEIALPVDERIANREILAETHERVIDRLVAMRVELTHDVTDDAGAFLVGLLRVEPEKPHGVQNAAMDRFQAVARIGQRAVHDGRQRVGEIAFLERRFEVDRLDFLAGAVAGSGRGNLL